MRKVTLLNLKGGVAKTTTAINMSTILSDIHAKKVLLVDNDIQANVSKFFNLHDYDSKSIEDIYRDEDINVKKLIRKTRHENLDIIPANMNLDNAISCFLMQEQGDQISRLSKALESVADEYDYCIIDCPPSIGWNDLNAIVASDAIIFPFK